MFKRNRALELTQSFLPESSAIRQFPLQKKFNGIAPSCNQTSAGRCRERAADGASQGKRPDFLSTEVLERDPSRRLQLKAMTPQGSLKGLSGERDLAPPRPLEHFAAFKAALFDAVPEPIVGVDGDGRIISWNGAAERVFGYNSIQAVSQPLVELIVPVRLRERHLRGFGGVRGVGGAQLPSRPIETWAGVPMAASFPLKSPFQV